MSEPRDIDFGFHVTHDALVADSPFWEDGVLARVKFLRDSSIALDASMYMRPHYVEMFGPTGERSVDEQRPPLRGYLASRWPADEVDAFMAQWEAQQARRAAVEAWRRTRRGRLVTWWRSTRVEVRDRIGGAWDILRHGNRYGDDD